VEPLSDEEIRVIGCLVEKEATVPDSYPLTLNALRQACNQSSSRDPVVSYDEDIVQDTLDSLKAAGLVRFVHPSHGERSTKFRHVLDDRLELGRPELAVLAVLALRGPQSATELRTRTERQHLFASPDEVEAALRSLAERAEPLVQLLPRQAGQQHARWVHLLGGPIDADAVAAMTTVASRPSAVGGSTGDRMAALEAEVAVLRGRLQRLEQALGVEGDEGDEEVDGVEGDDGDDGDGEAPVRPA
jgi:uncharacterized protein YceH (UPF0502 family)